MKRPVVPGGFVPTRRKYKTRPALYAGAAEIRAAADRVLINRIRATPIR